jgi:hypothetical protein
VSMAGAAPEAKPPSAAEVDALRKKVATLSAINGALRDENDELRRAVEEASLTGGTAGSDAERRLADAEEAIASLTRQRDELEALLLDRSEDDSQASSRLADAKRRANDREKELERSAREIGALQGERRKLELASADARRERDVAEQKLARAEETARFARERSDADARDAEALIEDLRRRLTRSERDAKAERVALLTQLEAAQTATAAALGEEAQTAVADAEARAAKAERDAAAARAAAAAAEAAAAEAADAAAMEIRGAESRARDAVASGEALDEAVASAVEETARAAERYRRECARAREALAAECERSAALEKELADDRRERSGTIEELTRKVQQASIERQAALGAVRDRASAAEADATRAEAKVVELTETTTSLLRKLEAMETENAARESKATALVFEIDALRAELKDTRSSAERLARERDRAREEKAEAEVKARENAEAANENVFTVERRTSNVAAREVPGALRAKDARLSFRDRSEIDVTQNDVRGGAFGGFDVTELIRGNSSGGSNRLFDPGGSSIGANESAMTARERRLVSAERERWTETLRLAVRDVELASAEVVEKQNAELADARERAESAESKLADLAVSTNDGDLDVEGDVGKKNANAAFQSILARYRSEARDAIDARAALLLEHETLLEVLGEKTELIDGLEKALRDLTERVERRDAMDAMDFALVSNRFGSSGAQKSRSGRRDAFLTTLTHSAFVAGGLEIDPADD